MLMSTARTYGYGRVSTLEQTTDNQRVELAAAGYELPERRWFADSISGKVPAMQRPEFARLMQFVEPGDTLVVAKLDRLGRDSLDVEQTLRMLDELQVSVIVLQLGKTDLTSTAGQLIRRILAAVADMERSMLVERTKAGMVRAKAEGKVFGRPYKTTPQQRERMKVQQKAGTSISALAREYGISRASVLSVVR
jgi:DNA invertase Pin-like site-specific DNA recombinase